ncbi:MAG TPA: hypothetical protein VHY35_06415 [Stellaceae bacterium]|jgi:hypothetical protein|nr:hypothetical protein [Stellaceae bacterium]
MGKYNVSITVLIGDNEEAKASVEVEASSAEEAVAWVKQYINIKYEGLLK